MIESRTAAMEQLLAAGLTAEGEQPGKPVGKKTK